MEADGYEHWEQVEESGGELASLGMFLGGANFPGAGKLGPLLLKILYFPSELPGSLVVVLARRSHARLSSLGSELWECDAEPTSFCTDGSTWKH